MDNRFVRGLLMGGMIGAAISMMMPMPAPRTRRRMQRTGRRIAGRAMNLMNDAREMVK
ncbi:MAG: YtxH domain-containing protein [Bacillota bacterium]|jgi:gas vesicle protein|nr:YtxH domain-containing protein [Bacillota bacterium]MDD3297638.1 YtxH domain-containing protein [Bacillota bacterium]MDD3850853.1 YtxH domain-containing protein [Bacillota bacterium]MDD4707489.1 YtxH domain-containing protein [Bacillota bacterium]